MKFTVVLIGLLVLFSSANGQGVGALRLVRNNLYSTIQAYTSGIVEIYYGSTWGNICDDAYFGSTEANVICHQLAYTGVSSYGNVGSTSIYGTDTNSMLLEDVDCSSSSYLVLLQCSYRSRYSSYCNNHDRDAFVVCYTTKIWSSNPYSGQLRIVGGDYSNRGRLEVYCNGQWGTVCDDSFSAIDANVACRQLGYSDYSRYEYTSIYDGSSTQPIWLDNVQCTSSSTRCLAYCEGCPSSQYHNCDHSEDVSLECEFSLSPSSGPYTIISTCNGANTPSTSTPSTSTSSTSTSSTSTSTTSSTNLAAIAGGVIGFVILVCVLIVLIVTIPLCICCCLGVGLGAACREGSRTSQTTVVRGAPAATTTAAVITTETKIDNFGDNAPPPYSQASSSYPTSGYPPQGYPATGYPQKSTATYPPQQPGAYLPQQPVYPPEAYPPQQLGAYPPAGTYPPQPSGINPSEGYPPQ